MRREIRRDKGVVERVDVLKVSLGVAFRLPENSEFDEIPDHFPNVGRPPDSPEFKDNGYHRTKVLQGQMPYSLAELGSRDVTALTKLPLPEFHGVIQGVAEEKIGVLMVSGVSLGQDDNGLREVEFLHVTVENCGGL